jgi:alpha-methylacyl-CoA racemase
VTYNLDHTHHDGPLAGLRVLEFAGVGPVPFCGMMLADMGAEVVRIDRIPVHTPENGLPGKAPPGSAHEHLDRGRRSVSLDLKQPTATGVALRLAQHSDVLLEGFRPGVMERLGLGPQPCFERNPSIVYGRVSGWGQDGPLADKAGHDINYLALSGALHPIGPAGEPPVPPMNYVGDFAAGGLLLLSGTLAALLERARSGQGEVVDASMVDGAALFTTQLHAWKSAGTMRERGANFIDGGAPFYGVYRTSDDKYVSVGAGEPAFYANLLRVLELDPATLPDRADHTRWPLLRERIAGRFATRTREQWCAAFDGVDACFAPVLDIDEAPEHPHLRARGTFTGRDGATWPSPAPRFGRTAGPPVDGPPRVGADTDDLLLAAGIEPDELVRLKRTGAVASGTRHTGGLSG